MSVFSEINPDNKWIFKGKKEIKSDMTVLMSGYMAIFLFNRVWFTNHASVLCRLRNMWEVSTQRRSSIVRSAIKPSAGLINYDSTCFATLTARTSCAPPVENSLRWFTYAQICVDTHTNAVHYDVYAFLRFWTQTHLLHLKVRHETYLRLCLCV